MGIRKKKVNVKGHTRKLPSGKKTSVKPHTREVTKKIRDKERKYIERAKKGDTKAKEELLDFVIEYKFGDLLEGGLADDSDLIEYDRDQLITGMWVEYEHTNDSFKALEIATDHLEEHPRYYDYLEEMENEMMIKKPEGPMIVSKLPDNGKIGDQYRKVIDGKMGKRIITFERAKTEGFGKWKIIKNEEYKG